MNTAQRYDLIETCIRLTSALHDLHECTNELLVEYTNESFPDLKLTVDEYLQYVKDEREWANLDTEKIYEYYYNTNFITDYQLSLH